VIRRHQTLGVTEVEPELGGEEMRITAADVVVPMIQVAKAA
jgi:hypothetical protein